MKNQLWEVKHIINSMYQLIKPPAVRLFQSPRIALKPKKDVNHFEERARIVKKGTC